MTINATSYYFSSLNGNDSNSGTSNTSPWKSMEKLQELLRNISAGDVILFERGSSWDRVRLNIENISGNEGSPIVFTAYGQGLKPRFKGSKVAGTFIREGNIWRLEDNDLPEYVVDATRLIPFIYIDERHYEVSRYPDNDYLYTGSTNVDYFLEDYSQNWENDQWVNGLAVVRVLNWKWYSRRINSNSNTRLDFDNFGSSYETSSTPYLIRNHVNACNLEGEWAQQNNTLWINYSSDLNTKKVEYPVVDIIFTIKNCHYLKFENLQVERSNLFNFYIETSNVEIVDCFISDAGGGLINSQEHSDVIISRNYFTRGRRGGIFLEKSHGEVSYNTFKKMAFDGAANTEKPYGACVMNWYCDDITSVDHNVMDSVNLGYHGHWSNAENYVTNNYITNFGLTVRDCGALYFGADYTGHSKIVNKNILINAHNKFVHGLYIDYSSNNVKADSNTIANTNIAIFIHASKNNEIRNTNIINPAYNMDPPAWNQAIRLDEYLYNHNGSDVSPIIYNNIQNNTIVLGRTQNEKAVMFFNVINDKHTNIIDNNLYFNPFGTHTDIITSGEDYSSYDSYDFYNWKITSGFDSHSELNPTHWTFQSVSGISEDDFVTLLFNPTDKDSIFDLRNLDTKFIDTHGNLYTDYVTVPAFYSKILFYVGVYELANHQPVIQNQQFTVRYEMDMSNYIGKILGQDYDQDQTLTYSIISGNTNNIFTLDSHSGNLYFNKEISNTSSKTYTLSVQVIDNGTPTLSQTAIITVYFIQNTRIIYIDPENTVDLQKNGSIDHPFSSWNEVNWVQGHTYLLKSGTSTNIEYFTIGADSITIGSFGDGEKPIIQFSTSNYAIRLFERRNIKIKNLNIIASNALSCIYSLGSNSNNIVIENCDLESNNTIINASGGNNFAFRYNIFRNSSTGISTYAENNNIEYNLFVNNQEGIIVNNNTSSNHILNNVFYNNLVGVVTGNSNLVLFNNIFYLTNSNDQAFIRGNVNFTADHNLYFPDHPGFISIEGKILNNLDEYKRELDIEKNSVNQDPLFQDTYINNFALQPGSPAIDAGTYTGISLDFVGNAVPYGNAPDMGIYELSDVQSSDPDIKVSNESFPFIIYPNPTAGQFNLSIKNKKFTHGSLILSSVAGDLIWQQNIYNTGDLIFNIPVNKGIYLIQLLDNKSIVLQTDKLIIY
ncbi:MAG: right-handed parallel beta-helix repeat-containing protein [Bacteroidales bacterium]|nr:right-handed parallel beta-helix repeat-containing protein [Bacteroidales bacterium]